ncbi:hypothetical protein K438DRAFT_1852040 [Mycena galopus ATCC 62051]|nr:hypothetical protein K438DRAFT_1852040 [Mycena galopus ATCC 62051]
MVMMFLGLRETRCTIVMVFLGALLRQSCVGHAPTLHLSIRGSKHSNICTLARDNYRIFCIKRCFRVQICYQVL